MAVPMPLKRSVSDDFLADSIPTLRLTNGMSDLHADMRADMHTNLAMDMHADMRADMHADMHTDMRADLFNRQHAGHMESRVEADMKSSQDAVNMMHTEERRPDFYGQLPAVDRVLSTSPSHIQYSPIKMLNTVARARPSKKRRLDNGATNSSVDGSVSPLTGDEAGDTDGSESAPMHHNFPCVWLDGNGPTQNDTPRTYIIQGSPDSHTSPIHHTVLPPSGGTENHHRPVLPTGGSPEHHVSPGHCPVQPFGASPEKCRPVLPAGESPEHHVAPGHHLVLPPSNGSPVKQRPLLPPGESPERHLSPNHRPLLPPNGPNGPGAMQPLPPGAMSPVVGPLDGVEGAGEVCPECHKVFKRRVYLQRHMEREHWSTAKVFRCDDCAYETKHQSNLSVHRRTHTGERPYHCGACGQRYTQGHLLKSHIRSRHGADMQFYNLDKKSESARGRKSLDPKHDQIPTISGSHKQDKISVLLQAASQQRFNLSHYMNVLSPYLRPPLVAPSVALAAAAAGGLLMGGPRYFALGGVPNALPAIGSAMLPPGALAAMSGMGQPLKEVDVSPPPPAAPPQPEPLVYTPPSPPLAPVSDDDNCLQEEAVVQDLSTKRCHATLEQTEEEEEEQPFYDVATMTQHCCDADMCQHGRQLKELRKDILRMLSVFTPELNIENGIDCDTDQVDQLLHEVVYSNDDDDDSDNDDRTTDEQVETREETSTE